VQALTREEAIRLSIMTLRVSENKYTGKGGTDTGHRLFILRSWIRRLGSGWISLR
jgi:hypothetical protein